MMPDLVGVSLQSLLTRVAKLEARAEAHRLAASSGHPRPEFGTARTSRSESE